MNINPDYRKALAKWGHTGEGETFEILMVPPVKHIEFNLEFDVSIIEKLIDFESKPEGWTLWGDHFKKMAHDGP